MQQELQNIIDSVDRQAMIEWLKNLTPQERKSLVPDIKKADKEYKDSEGKNDTPRRWEKLKLISLAKFICLPASEAKKIPRWSMPEPEELDIILPWYCPKNLQEFEFSRSYEHLIKWEEAGYITLKQEDILSVFPSIIFEKNEKGYRQTSWTLERIEQTPIALQEHIWWLFQAPSNVDWADKWLADNKDRNTSKGNWCDFFIKYTTEGRLDRMRVLRESLMTANRNFNKTQTGWFVDLFMVLEPTTDELIDLQEELFGTLSCVWSKPVSNTTKLLKKLATDKRFDIAAFLPALPILLSSEVKSIVISSLGIVEALLKNKTTYHDEICATLCMAFLSKEEDIQKKAAGLFTKYTSPGIDAQEMLSAYTDNLLMNTRNLLIEYLSESKPIESSTKDIDIPLQASFIICEDNRIPVIESVEDFAFFLSQALDFPEPYFLDHLFNNLVVWGNEVTVEDLVLFEPTFQKIAKIFSKWNTPPHNMIPHLLLIEYADYLIQKFGDKAIKLKKIQQKITEADKQKSGRSQYYKLRYIPLKSLSLDLSYTGFWKIALSTIEKIRRQDVLPLLSTPTHLPGWIDPLALVDKLLVYQQQRAIPADMDMQLAMQRCALDNPEEALQKTSECLSGELKNLIFFLLNKEAAPQKPFDHPSWWMTAAITKMSNQSYPEFDAFGYNTIPSAYITGNHEWEGYIDKGYNDKYEWKHIRITTPEWKSQLKKNELFYRYIWNGNFYDGNIDYLYLAAPNNPDYLLGRTTTYFANCDMWEVSEQSIALHLASLMNNLKSPFHEMHYMALACMLMPKIKTVQDYAFAIWSERIASNQLDAIRLGKAIGKVEHLETFPLKRLTDLISEYMIGISPQHNNALVEMIQAILIELPEKPLKNQKKLLELYYELLAQTQLKPDIKNIPHWDKWATEGSLKKVIEQINGLQHL